MRHSTILDDLRHDEFHLIDRNSKTNTASRSIELGINRSQCRNTNHISLQVSQSPTAIAWIDGCIGLNGIGNGSYIILRHATAQRTDDAMSYCFRNSQWITDCQYILS